MAKKLNVAVFSNCQFSSFHWGWKQRLLSNGLSVPRATS